MSGLDPVTEEHIFEKLLGPDGMLKQRGTTVIMVTNSGKNYFEQDSYL
jgi:ATP-binding cassette subfamily C (CFTR/MRP) protein 1